MSELLVFVNTQLVTSVLIIVIKIGQVFKLNSRTSFFCVTIVNKNENLLKARLMKAILKN